MQCTICKCFVSLSLNFATGGEGRGARIGGFPQLTFRWYIIHVLWICSFVSLPTAAGSASKPVKAIGHKQNQERDLGIEVKEEEKNVCVGQ